MRKMIQRLILIFVILCMAPQARAAQTLIRDIDNTNASYLSTPTKVYTSEGWVYKFKADGKTNYPDEIYLPNENNPASYRIHSNYTKNTDACASCHSTHTAVGNSLLQWYDNYQTCMACHDGTVSTTYNVAEGVVPHTMQPTQGGAFGNGSESYSSYHNVTGGVLIGSAPGNNLSKGLNNDKPLGCESCHSPHGLGGNARLLNPDPNGVQTKLASKFTNYSLIEIGTNQINGVVDKVIYAAYPEKSDGSLDTTIDPYYMLKGYPYKVKLTINGQVYDQNDGVFEINNSLGYTRVFVWKDLISGPIKATFIPSLRVRMNISNYLGESGQELIQYRDGTTQFCSSCHSDYSDSVSANTYKHPVDISVYNTSVSIDTNSVIYQNEIQHKFETGAKVVCLTCHFAHGTSSEFWQKTLGYDVPSSRENAGSSALKVAPNSDLCEACHQKGSGNEGYSANTNQIHDDPVYGSSDAMFTQPLGISNYVGNNLTSCAGSTCHKSMADTWKNTLHGQSLTNGNSAIASEAKTDFTNKTNITISQVVYVIGNKWKQRYIWDDNGTLKVAPNEFVISSKSWETATKVDDFVKDCAGCHTTGLNVDSGTWSDNGVACEACHGAGKNHVQLASNRNITNPRYLNVKDQTDVCAQCHALGSSKDNVHPYQVGYMPYAEGLKDPVTKSVYTLNNFFKIYDKIDYPGNFYSNSNPDSSIKDSVYSSQEFNDFVQSKHYASGAMSCTTCHSSHKPNNNGQMLKVTFEQTCASCHGTNFDINAVMPKRVKITGNAADNLRVHTFSKQHDENNSNDGNYISIH